MYEGVKSAAVHSPTTLTELTALRRRLPKALLWAGGTDIMSRLRPYPASDGIDIIYMGNVQELARISRSERYIEIGAMVPVQNILAVGQHILHPVFSRACMLTAPHVIRSRATFGGALGAPGRALNIPAALSVLEAQAELRNPVSRKSGSQWIPIHRLFSKAGYRESLAPSFITRVRILLEDQDFSFFRTVGEPYTRPQEAVILAVHARFNLPAVAEYRFSLTFPQSGILRSRELETAVSGSDIPFSRRDLNRIGRILTHALNDMNPQISELQKTRAQRVFELSIHRMNSESL